MGRNVDARSKKIIFVSSCLLNTNNKVFGLARYPGMCKEIVDILQRYNLGIKQMQCPETLYMGINRWWTTKNLYENHGFRCFCKELTQQVVTYMEEYERVGYKTVGILGCDGSPTCGVDITCWDDRWGGSPDKFEFHDAIIEGSGIYMEELKKEIKARGVTVPPFYGLALDDESESMDKILMDFEKYIVKICK